MTKITKEIAEMGMTNDQYYTLLKSLIVLLQAGRAEEVQKILEDTLARL